jgi:hypothetical protein
MSFNHDEHPHGTTLLIRDTKSNRKIWGANATFGYIDVAPTVCTAHGECPHYHYTDDAASELTTTASQATPIHMLIASYRDRLCPRTLHNAFTHAHNPERLFIRIIDQTQVGSDLIDDGGCWTQYCIAYNTNCQEFKSQVLVVHVDATKAKGPTDPRSKLSALIRWDYLHRKDPEPTSTPTSTDTDAGIEDERSNLELKGVHANDFCMQIDSHMDFSDNFDTELVDMFHRAHNDYAVLSTYVAAMDQNNQNVRQAVPNLCMVEFTSSIRNYGTKECKFLKVPKLTNAMWGAGLSFHRCHAELNVPVDPYLDGVFDGEEGSRGLRFFTHGYDVYTPDVVLVTHDYAGHQHNPIVHTWDRRAAAFQVQDKWRWNADIEQSRGDLKSFGEKRINAMLGIGATTDPTSTEEVNEINLIRSGRFGIGPKRTLEQAVSFSGIDLKRRKMVENKCGNLEWVPFEESPNYGLDDLLLRSLAGEVVSSPSSSLLRPDIPVGPTHTSSSLLRADIPVGPMHTANSNAATTNAYVPWFGGVLLSVLVIGRLVRRNSRTKGDYHKK